jgi:glucan phosphoethanolaminetransferase (alkaline phosphatase superfamily)
MLQRIQSVFMFIVVLSGILLFFFPLASYFSDLGYYKFYLFSIRDMVHDPFGQSATPLFSSWFTMPLLILHIVVVALAAITIFKFKSRVLQIKLNRLNIFLNVILVGGIFMYSTLIEDTVGATPDYGFGNVLPLISIISLFFANNYIRKDERLIRSSERLR